MENAVEMKSASFTWERTSTHDKNKPGAFQSKKQLKDAKALHKQEKKAEKVTKRIKPIVGGSQDDVSTDARLEPFKLRDMDFSVGRNELIAVIGTVGSGKSSLLAALAGDMRRTGGKIYMGASRAFCPQYAWIQNATLRENIVFGKPYDDDWYDKVVGRMRSQTRSRNSTRW